MRLNLGCGDRYQDGWVNVDLYAERVDIREDLRLFVPPDGITEAQAIHVVEHLNRIDAIRLLSRLFDAMQPGALLAIEMPERDRCIRLCRAKKWKDRVNGAKGLLGGRAESKAEWNRFLLAHAEEAAQHAERKDFSTGWLPDGYTPPGFAHLYVWSEAELSGVLTSMGFDVTMATPQTHGKRTQRDCRWQAVKR